jgi:hypothetical protein
MKDFKTAFGDTIVKSQSPAGAESQVTIKGDYTVDGSPVTIGVEVAGPTELFDCIKEFNS